MKMKGFNTFIIIVIALFLSSFVTVVKAQPYYDASFTKIMVTDGNGSSDLLSGGTAKVYEGQTTWINLTFHNTNCGMPWGYLYTRIYEGNVPIHTSGERIVWLGTDSQDTWSLTASGGPIIRTYRVEVWWESSGTHYLEDEHTFNVQIVRLFATNWSPSSLTVEKGRTSASTWSISFKNGGNDMMYSASISIVDSSGLQMSPSSNNLGDIASQGAKSTSFSVTAPSTLSIGYKTVSMQLSYNDFEGNSHSESQTGSIYASSMGTSITVTLSPSTVKKDGSTTITAKLLDDNGNPIASQAINFSVGRTSLGSANTDSSGNAVKQFTANVDAGTYVANASYVGSSDYEASIGTSNLIVNAFTTNLTIDVPSAIQGQSVTLKATLKDENGNPIQGISIQFQMYDGTSWTNMSSASTDSNGVASITHTSSSTGSYQVKAVFAGATNYASSQSTSANLDVGMDYTPYYVGGGIIAVIVLGAIGYMVYRRMRRKTNPQK